MHSAPGALSSLLAEGAEQLRIDLTPKVSQRLIEYLGLMVKWNKAYNLTAIRDPHEMMIRHILDSLAVSPHCSEGHVLDVGAGAGLPSVVLAITNPQRAVTAIDSNSKKTRFLRQVVIELSLDNLSVEHSRVESFTPVQPFAIVISRAFSSLVDFVHVAQRLVYPGGRMLAMKGRYPTDELEHAAPLCDISDVVKLSVPFLSEERHLVIAHPKYSS